VILQLVFVKTLSGDTVVIDLHDVSSATVADFKVAVEGKTGVPPDQQVLTYGRKTLDGGLLEDYGIRKVAMLLQY
jgi:hypothetical protein